MRKPAQPVNTGQRSPLRTKGIEYTYGIKNLQSDHIGSIVENKYMVEAARINREKELEAQKKKNMAPKGLKSKPTVTSKLRQEANKQIAVDLQKSTPGRLSFSKRNLSVGTASNKILPPLKGSSHLSKRGLESAFEISDGVTQRINPSRSGSYRGSKYSKNAQHERVLFPTMVKETFLQRNKHIASVKMEQMAAEFAKRALGGRM